MNTEGQTHTRQGTRFFYGWVIVGVMAVVAAITPSLATLNFGLFIKPMGNELGIGRSIFGWAMTARQVGSAIASPIVGRLVDRFGSRIMLATGSIVVGAAIFGLGFIQHSWQLVLLFAAMGLIGIGGPGALVTSVPIFKWFIHNRGKAVSFTSLGTPVGAVIFIPLTQILIASRGWREAWIILAIISVGMIVPLSLTLIRRQPEDMNLLPDGAKAPRKSVLNPTSPAKSREEVSWTVQETIRTSVFWRLVAVFSFMFLTMGSVGIHRIPFFMDRGLDPSLVSYATAFDAVAAGVSIFISGLLVRRFPAKFLGGISFLMLAVATVLTIYTYTFPIMFLSMSLFGFGIGGMIFTSRFLWAEYYGRQHLGSILGLATTICLLVGGIGAPLAGYVHDTTGYYNTIWWVSAGLMLTCGIALVTAPIPRKPTIKT
ncbi:MAG: MFS transporter [Dehalococcoidales bacterium]|nr:MFS transporter [Dehalococcoidales bacterium]MDP6738298.1 MFS transporter [Dehalococcoidales bacterium]